MSVINTNITSMIGQQNLRESQNALTTSMERLSSGMRINSAKDDAAGQAIANRMTAQITGLNQASRNANDGISIAQTAEGSLNQINDNVQRIRELTVQAQNGTNSQADLGSIQDEITQRLAEIDRISAETDFNGTKVLADGVQAMDIQVGANDGETISIALQAINSSALNIDDFSVRGIEQPEAVTFGSGSTELSTLVVDGTTFNFGSAASADASANAVTFSAAPTLNTSAVPAGVTSATLVQREDGSFLARVGSGSAADFYEVDFAVATAGTASAAAVLEFSIRGGAEAQPLDAARAGLTDVAANVTEATANPLATLDSALSTIDGLRSELGAVQNRFEDAITNLDTNATNLSAARSRIEDADYAVEVASMTRAQILQQAGTSVLAQANQIPQNVLSLLG
ncbi:flagellin [Halomonas sp. A020]|uniref:FliC/FljB family flagellin n=1 Tax=Halomonas sp. A020 TaxID=2717374 RepID=UPI002493043D|nr:FliC/FljB family flagellin [Halomonas sp. A020]BCB59939.1 flagellin [Halomonas sp. A020]